MKTKEQKEEFIRLRAEGISFDKISKKLKISRSTLISWNVKLQKEISNVEFIHFESIIEQFKITKRKRIEFLSNHINKINEALDSIDYKELSIQDLLKLKSDYLFELRKETENKVEYLTGEMIKVTSSVYGFDSKEITAEKVLKLDFNQTKNEPFPEFPESYKEVK